MPTQVKDRKKRVSAVAKKAKVRQAKGEPKAKVDAEPVEAPAPPRKTKARRLEEMASAPAKASGKNEPPRGVIYLGHLPNGFFEPQMRKFFAQFGKITRLRLSRSKKNAQSKGYAFVEFEEEAVAKIVAETMHKYLLFGKQLVCHILPKEKQHGSLWRGCNKRMKNLTVQRRKDARESYNDRPTVEVGGELVPQTTLRQAGRRELKQKRLQAMLKESGVDFDLEAVMRGDGEGDDLEAASKKSPKKSPKAAPSKSPNKGPKRAAEVEAAVSKKGAKKRKTK